ncbi:uncharacterized protein LOC135842667 [Planococcus citri]|uniref:uncharacterized protein LOC135842667 n=1 Tax=Planococcus citri TaxID=170843 RepID=UPI0031FA3BEA
MNSIILYILCVSSVRVLSKKALLFSTKITVVLEDVCRKDGDRILFTYLAACPAFTHQERQFNQDVSLTQRSVFSRRIFAKNGSFKNIDTDFCEKSFKPAMLYDRCEKQYEIGYEVYYNDGEIPHEWYSANRKDKYYCLKSVNTKKPKHKIIENRTIAITTSELVDRHEDNMNVKFNFKNGSRTLAFYWINVLSIKRCKNKKKVHLKDSYMKRSSQDNELSNFQDKCENYQQNVDNVYLKKNQKNLLKDVLAPSSLFEGNPDLSCGQPYGCLTPSQIIPLWFFSKNSARLASCSHMNVIPVWKSIADNNLKKVDLFLVATYKCSNKCDVVFGTSGVLKMKISSFPNVTRKMYLSNAKRDRIVEIPRIIYRVVRVDLKWQYTDEFIYAYAAIILHNDPTAVPDTDRLCNKSDAPTGWEKIFNDDPRTGLTYVCPMTEALNNKLGAFDSVQKYETHPLNMNAVGYIKFFEGDDSFIDEAEGINSYFEHLLKNNSLNLETVS